VLAYLVGVEHLAGERVVPQGAGGAGAAVVQRLPAVLHLLLVLPLKVSRALEEPEEQEEQEEEEGKGAEEQQVN